jgi:hypothetical protein
MQEAIHEREAALERLDEHIFELSALYRESYLKTGRGALVVHTHLLEAGHRPSTIDYHTKKQSLNLFDAKNSKRQIADMIDGYDPKSEGILVLITSATGNATWFITVKLKSRSR